MRDAGSSNGIGAHASGKTTIASVITFEFSSGSLNVYRAAAAVYTRPVNQAPWVNITAPKTGDILTAPGSTTISADAGDNDGTAAAVAFYANGTLIGSSGYPYRVTWSFTSAGTYTLTAIATDNAGQATTSAAVTVTANAASPANVPPTVTLTSPANGASFTAPATLQLQASASDADGSVVSVAFFQNGALLYTDTAAPYVYTWSNLMGGNYTFTAVATDNLGATTTSNQVRVSVRGKKK